METIRTQYIGDLRTEATHVRSGVKLVTDAPVDNKGKGESFSPTDLLATALASCMITIVGIAAQTHGFDINGVSIKTTKVMAENPRRVGELIVEIDFREKQLSEKDKKIIEVAAKTCPVALSLHPDLKQTFHFLY